MTEREKMTAGALYDAAGDRELAALRDRCKELCHRFNQLPPSRHQEQEALLRQILGRAGREPVITAPFWCDYGFHITVGDNFYANHNCVILDTAPVAFGDNVMVGPNCCFAAAAHPLDRRRRRMGLEFSRPISVGDDVWLGANVTVLPGVSIGAGSIIGAGSVVTRDIPPGVIAAGVPCRPVRPVPADGPEGEE